MPHLSQPVDLDTSATTAKKPECSTMVLSDGNELVRKNEPIFPETVRSISRLPVEMLREIFTHIYYSPNDDLESDENRYRRWSVLPLTKVCRLWHAVVISTPSFWTEINLRQPEFATICIERSHLLPLSVRFTPPPSLYSRGGQRNPLLETSCATALSQRTTELNAMVEWDDIEETFNMVQNGGWERLEKLCLTLHHAPPSTLDDDILNFDRWSFCNMHHLSLTSFYISLDSPFYGQNLTTVVLKDIPTFIFIDDLLEFIHDHPQLENLFVRRIILFEFQECAPIARFTHRNLKWLCFRDFLDYSTARHLFEKFFTDAHLELTCNTQWNQSFDLFPPEHPIRQRFSHLQTVRVRVTAQSLTFGGHAGADDLVFLPVSPCDDYATDIIDLGVNDHPHHPILDFAKEYSSSDCKHLIITSGERLPWYMRIEDWIVVLEHFPNLESIHLPLTNMPADTPNMFKALAAVSRSVPKHISIEGLSQTTSFEAIQKSIQSLHENGRGLHTLKLDIRGQPFEDDPNLGLLEASKMYYETMMKPWVEMLEVEMRPYYWHN